MANICQFHQAADSSRHCDDYTVAAARWPAVFALSFGSVGTGRKSSSIRSTLRGLCWWELGGGGASIYSQTQQEVVTVFDRTRTASWSSSRSLPSEFIRDEHLNRTKDSLSCQSSLTQCFKLRLASVFLDMTEPPPLFLNACLFFGNNQQSQHPKRSGDTTKVFQSRSNSCCAWCRPLRILFVSLAFYSSVAVVVPRLERQRVYK